MLAMELDRVGPNDKSPMDTYGQVIDQDGQPVVGAKVRGWLRFEHGEDEEHDTKTDAQGRFQFLGLHGKGLGIIPEKAGYEFNREYRFIANARRPDFYIPDQKTPLIFRMWKLRGGEPMSLVRIDSFVKWGENFKHFDPYTSLIDRAGMPHPHGTDSDPLGTDGELMVKATRGIEFTNRGVREFPWAVTLHIRDGGLRPILNEPYPYVAPTNGYESSVTVTGPTNVVANGNELRHGFYFKSQSDQVYGRMVIRMNAGKNYASFDAEIYANPAGSRNLEFDGNKSIELPPRALSEATVRRLAIKHRDAWVKLPSSQSYPNMPLFAKGSIVSIDKKMDGWEKGGWRVTFVTPGDNKPAVPTMTNDYRLDYRLYIDLQADGQFTRARMGDAGEYLVAGKDTVWGIYVLNCTKVAIPWCEGVRITSKDSDGQVTTITANRCLLNFPDAFSINLKLFNPHIEKGNITSNYPNDTVLLHL